jgi:hypothetical protein
MGRVIVRSELDAASLAGLNTHTHTHTHTHSLSLSLSYKHKQSKGTDLAVEKSISVLKVKKSVNVHLEMRNVIKKKKKGCTLINSIRKGRKFLV